MTVDDIPESYEALEFTLASAEARAAELQAEGRQTRVEESLMHPGQWAVHATPEPELPDKPEDEQAAVVEDRSAGTTDSPIEDVQAAVAEDAPEPTVKSAPEPAELQTKSAAVSVLKSVFHSHAEAEAEAKKLQSEGRKTVIRHANLHPQNWHVYASSLSYPRTRSD